QTDVTTAGSPANALRNPGGGFSLNITENLAESIPRLDALLRGAQRLPGGLNFHALLSRFLPQLGSGPFGAQSGAERLNLPISLYVRWLTGRQYSDQGNLHHHHHHHQQQQQQHQQHRLPHDHAHSRRVRGNGNGGNSQCSTPDDSGNPSAVPSYAASGLNSVLADRVSSEQEAKIREQVETYQYMYSRFYEVIQSVQRDNYVGLPSAALFEHLSSDKEELDTRALYQGRPGVRTEAEPLDGQEYEDDDDDEDEIGDEEDDEEQEDEDDEEDDYMYPRASAISGASGFMAEPAISSLPQFLQNIVEHIRTLSASGASQASLQSLASST
ncbi:hypothetical protein FB639_006087, partial [Coemansia asiatica]